MEWAKKTMVLWAGIVIGGSLIAAPTKFQVPDLTLPVALQVGRAQFLGVTVAELCCLIAIAICFAFDFRKLSRLHLFLMASVVLLLAAQHLAMMPLLQARSDLIIRGENVEESKLHVVYVLLEVTKVATLLAASFCREEVVEREARSQ